MSKSKTKNDYSTPVALIVSCLAVLGVYYLFSAPPINPPQNSSTAASSTTTVTDEKTENPVQNAKPANTYSDTAAFETSFDNFNTASAKLFAYVIAFNISGVSPEIQEFQDNFQQIVKSTDAGSRLYLAQQGLPLVQKYLAKLESTPDLGSAENSALIDLNTKAGAVRNPNLRTQALTVANDANQLSQFIRAYQSALEDKWNVVSTVFQDVINENGGLNSAYVELQSTSQQVAADNNTIGKLQSGAFSVSQIQTDFAQFKGLVQSQ